MSFYYSQCHKEACERYAELLRENVLKKLDDLNKISPDFENESFKNLSFKGISFKGLLFKNVSFKNVSFKNVTLQNAIFIDCVFINCDFENTKYLRSTMYKCRARYV